MDNMEEFKQIFFTECSELLVDMEERLLKLAPNVQDTDQLNAIFRCAHSIKGGSGAFGFSAIMQFTHTLEALLDAMRDGKILPSREVIDVLLKSADIVTQMLRAAQEGREPPANLGTEVLAKLQGFIHGESTPAHINIPASTAAAVGENVFEIRFIPHNDLFQSGNEPLHVLRELSRMGDVEITAQTDNIPALTELAPSHCFLGWTIKLTTEAEESAVAEVFEFVQHLSDVEIKTIALASASAPASLIEKPAAEEAPAKPVAVATGASTATTSIRVDLDKVDRLVNMVGELVITEAMLRAQSRHMPMDQLTDLMRGLDELSHHTRELQEAVMAVRMQPVKSVFSRMPRIVRDTSNQLGKDIQLILSGENTEVDKTVIEQLGDPLTHMIRNSVDHGVEMPDAREASGKPRQGTIHLSAYHRSGRIIIEIRDDGAGINRGRVLKKAKEKGLVAPDATLSDEEIDHLIFLPGFSTAEQVTSVSGRGVGMDVVRRNIENLGGTVRIGNQPGTGSVFTISLPLTLAILDGMIVRVGKENYIVPITSIIETMRPKTSDVRHVEGKGDVISVRGEFVPVVYLHKIFSISDAEQAISKTLVVLVEGSRGKMGLIVDELVGQQQVVIKSLEANADPVKGISGATILGDGKVSLILEINELHQLCNTSNTAQFGMKAA